MALQKASASPDRGQHAKLIDYSEGSAQFGVMAHDGTATKKNDHRVKKKKIVLDHLCVDVPTDAMLKEMFDYFDQDASGAIDIKEFRQVYKESFENFGAPVEDRDLDRLFEKFDRGGRGSGVAGDGKLHFEEFCVLILHVLKQ